MVDKIWYNMEELIGGSEERVLIETYWNVKTQPQEVRERPESGINRNILECKVCCYFSIVNSDLVLIETYWNVKIVQNNPTLNCILCINRNILECKENLNGHLFRASAGINRNILECKDTLTARNEKRI